MLNKITKQKSLVVVSVIAILATSYAAVLFCKNNYLSKDINETSRANEKLTFLLSLERPGALTSAVQGSIEKLGDHMYKIRNDQKEKNSLDA